MKRHLWPSMIVCNVSLGLGAVLAIVTAVLLIRYQPIVAPAIVGAVVIASVFGREVSRRIAEPTSPALRLPNDLKYVLRNIGVSYFWLTILGLCYAFLSSAAVYLWQSFIVLLR